MHESTARRIYAAIIVFVVLMAGCAAPQSQAEKSAVHGQAADVGTTAVALAAGAAEANPMGLALLPVKYWLHGYIKQQPEADQPELWNIYGAYGWGATANNACVIIGLATGGFGSLFVCPIVGLVTGLASFNNGKPAAENLEGAP